MDCSLPGPVAMRFFLQADLLLTEPTWEADRGMVGVESSSISNLVTLNSVAKD